MQLQQAADNLDYLAFALRKDIGILTKQQQDVFWKCYKMAIGSMRALNETKETLINLAAKSSTIYGTYAPYAYGIEDALLIINDKIAKIEKGDDA